MAGPTTNAEIRERYENGKHLADGAVGNVVTDSPANAADTVVGADTDVHVVTADGTNTVDLSGAAEAGRVVTVVHNGGAATPTLSFTDADFVGTGPANITSAGATATVCNVDGTASGWVVIATGSA
ncbi:MULTISPECIES: hypothetical protein [Halorussus]|uniref:hypothetical protein n=1 Tax=Halorussus TaxID=1070314 RepID=UPI00209F979F|nr:hypothetical protein [Halorussus vallis]USZ75659.1 hypothetical protein NGM07_19800 [Halorussus vallis]USZ75714.1 hypothetical protein NGM07_20080 [Halorussus vallis]USZ75732.1 hypothetical protein NGM07_00025 [Halorussus vallis]